MRRSVTLSILFVIVIISSFNKVSAQSFIEFSKLEDTLALVNGVTSMQVVDGNAYTLSTSFPDGPVFLTLSKVTKYKQDGSVEYSRVIPLDSTYQFSTMKIVNGEVYLLGWSIMGPYGVHSAVIKLAVDGTIAYTKIYPLGFYSADVLPGNNEMLVTGGVADPDFPMTMGGTLSNVANARGFIGKISLATGEITQSMYLGFGAYATKVQIENGAIFLTTKCNYSFPLLPVTIGNVPAIPAQGEDGNLYVEKLNISDFSVAYSRYISENAFVNANASLVKNGEFYLVGTTISSNFTVTNGSTISSGPLPIDGFFTKLNADGSIGFSTYLSLPGFRSYPRNIAVSNGKTYLGGVGRNVIEGLNNVSFVYQFNPDGSIGYSKQFSGDGYIYTYAQFFEVINGELYIASSGTGPNYPVTDGSQYQGYFSQQYTHLDAFGNIKFASYIGSGLAIANVYNNRIFIATGTEFGTHPATDGSTGSGFADNLIFAINTDDSQPFSTYIGGSMDDGPQTMQADNGSLYIYGMTWSEDYPLTSDSLFHGKIDCFLTKLAFCPAIMPQRMIL